MFLRISIVLTVLVLIGAASFSVSFNTTRPKQNAKNVFARTLTKLGEVKSFRLKGTICTTLKINNLSSGIDQALSNGPKQELSGIQQNPDMTYIEWRTAGGTDAFYTKGNKTAYKSFRSDRWMPYLKICKLIPGWPITQAQMVTEYIKNAELTNPIEINGIKCPGVSATLNDDGLIELSRINESNTTGKSDYLISNAFYQLWFDPISLLICRFAYSIEQSKEFPQNQDGEFVKAVSTTIISVELFDYNKNIEINFPNDVETLFKNATPDDVRNAQIQLIKDVFGGILKEGDTSDKEKQGGRK